MWLVLRPSVSEKMPDSHWQKYQPFFESARVHCRAGPKQSANRIEPRCPHWGVVSLQQLRFRKPK
jgi:hypothetical protein